MLLFGYNPSEKSVSGESLPSVSMPSHHISKEMKAQILVLFHQGFNIKEICDMLDLRESLIYQTL
jgi:hypothetical protein